MKRAMAFTSYATSRTERWALSSNVFVSRTITSVQKRLET